MVFLPNPSLVAIAFALKPCMYREAISNVEILDEGFLATSGSQDSRNSALQLPGVARCGRTWLCTGTVITQLFNLAQSVTFLISGCIPKELDP
jgi:hypothetical protein